METYIALLRGINVGGHKRVPMAELRTLFAKLGYADAITYIQSGNVVFNAPLSHEGHLSATLETGIKETFGFDVPVLLRNKRQLRSMMTENPFVGASGFTESQMYYLLLKQWPAVSLSVLEKAAYPNEKFALGTDCLYLYCTKGYGNAKLNAAVLERKLKVGVTARNHKTMQKILELSGV